MKIIQLITRLDTVGGAQAHMLDISIRLKESGHTVYVITGGSQQIHEVLEKQDIPILYCKHLIHRINIISDSRAIIELRKIIKTIQPDLIAIHSSKAGIIGRIVGWILGIPTIFTAHGWSFTDGIPKMRKRFYTHIEKSIGFLSDGVITVSNYDRQLALQNKILPERKMLTIHNGVHDVICTPREKSTSEVPKLIMVARFAPPKKQLQLLKALNQLTQKKWSMYFAGEGGLLTEAKSYVEKEGLLERVFFLGNRQDIDELLCDADLFILISDWEGLPLSILEAMRCGLPIIASNVGGVKEAVLPSINGFLVEKNDEQNLLLALNELLDDQTRRHAMGEKSRFLYEEKFTFEQMYRKTLRFYEKVIAEKDSQSLKINDKEGK